MCVCVSCTLIFKLIDVYLSRFGFALNKSKSTLCNRFINRKLCIYPIHLATTVFRYFDHIQINSLTSWKWLYLMTGYRKKVPIHFELCTKLIDDWKHITIHKQNTSVNFIQASLPMKLCCCLYVFFLCVCSVLFRFQKCKST